MKKLFLALLLAATPAFAGEDKITKGYNSMDAMGCMLVRECTKDVDEVHSILDISSQSVSYTHLTLPTICSV